MASKRQVWAEISCQECGSAFVPTRAASRFCADPCRRRYYRKNPTGNAKKCELACFCGRCGVAFTSSREAQFCSANCRILAAYHRRPVADRHQKRIARKASLRVEIPCAGCQKPFTVTRAQAETRRFCGAECSRRAVKPPSPPRAESRACAHCDSAFQPRRATRKYCSRTCVYLAQQKPVYPFSSVHFPTCQCGRVFTSRKSGTLWCSAYCYRKYNTWKTQTPCRECGGPIPTEHGDRPRSVCSDECYTAARARVKKKHRGARKHRQRAAHFGVDFRSLKAVTIYERDNWVCGICCLPVDRDATAPDDNSPSIDHIIPMSKGGDHVESNVRCAHFGCNSRRGNRITESDVEAAFDLLMKEYREIVGRVRALGVSLPEWV